MGGALVWNIIAWLKFKLSYFAMLQSSMLATTPQRFFLDNKNRTIHLCYRLNKWFGLKFPQAYQIWHTSEKCWRFLLPKTTKMRILIDIVQCIMIIHLEIEWQEIIINFLFFDWTFSDNFGKNCISEMDSSFFKQQKIKMI